MEIHSCDAITTTTFQGSFIDNFNSEGQFVQTS